MKLKVYKTTDPARNPALKPRLRPWVLQVGPFCVAFPSFDAAKSEAWKFQETGSAMSVDMERGPK